MYRRSPNRHGVTMTGASGVLAARRLSEIDAGVMFIEAGEGDV